MEIQNREVIKRLEEETKLSGTLGQISSNLSSTIVPVIIANANKKHLIVSGHLSDGASLNLLTASLRKRTFITGVVMSYSKDVNATSVMSYITMVLNDTGLTVFPAAMRYEPLTAGSNSLSVVFSEPIEIQKGSNVVLNHTAAIASIDTSAACFYYEIDDM